MDNEEEYKDKGQVRVDTNRSKEQLACVSYAAIFVKYSFRIHIHLK